MYEIAAETTAGNWETYYAGREWSEATKQYTRLAELMTQRQIKRVQLREDGRFVSEVTM
jgi:hypothetical protein